MGVDKMGVDKIGVDEMGVDEMGGNPLKEWLPQWLPLLLIRFSCHK